MAGWILKKKRLILLGVAAVLLLALILWIIWGNKALELNTYTITSPELPETFDGFRIAHVSDLHNTQIGEDNETLLAMLRQAEPDMIALTGDLIDSRNTDIAIALAFVEEAVKIAPCYYVTGNHESRIDDYGKLKDGLTRLGVTVLEDEAITLTRSGQSVTLLGVNDPTFQPDYGSETALMTDTLAALDDPDRGYTILLSHRPEQFQVYVDAGMNLVLSGHAHGGQIRLPFVGGLIAPRQGLFPEYDAGLYTQGETNMLVSRGIGNSLFPFRVNNRPEVILIQLQSAN